MTTHYRTCSLCEAMCGLAIEVEGGRVVSIRGDKDDPFSRGFLCPKGLALQDIHEDPDRLKRPLRRQGTSWQEISWAEAFDEAAARIAAIQEKHGTSAVGLYLGNPTVHNYGALLYSQLLARALRSRSRFSATSVDQLPQMLASLLMFGHQLLLPIPDVDRTDFLLMLGANPLASNGSLMTAPGIGRRLRAIQARGGRLVVVDPRRTETAALADEHVPIRPGTDALFLAALVQTLFAEGRVDLGRLAAFTGGVEAVAAAVSAYTPEVVAAATGIPAEITRRLALAFAAAPTAVCYGRVGISTQEFGGLASWLVNVLNVVTGNLDRPGGAMFTRPAVDMVGFADQIGQRGHFDKGKSRVRGAPEFGGEWPVAVLAEEIETPGEGQIRGLVTLAGNPVLSTPNGARLSSALDTLDFMVSIDFYLNETSRHAHLILPPTGPLEHDHYDLVFHTLAVRNTAKYSPALFRPAPDTRHDWEILLELSTRLSARRDGRLKAAVRGRLLRALGPRGALALLLRRGPYGRGWRPWGGLSLRRLRRSPHGIDLGPLAPCLPERLFTRERRIELAPQRLVADLERLSASMAAAPAPLVMIGRRDLRSNNSWMHNSPRLVNGRARCTLLMHPDDAARRSLCPGQAVRVTSRVGSVEVPLEVSADLRPGVVCLPHGWGHHRAGARLSVASTHAGASLNDLTDEARLDALCGTAAFSGLPVEVRPAAGAERR